MSRPLDTLVGEGLLTSRRKLVRDGVRKQITYSLTEEGWTRLRRETKEIPVLSGEIPAPPHPFLGRKEELTQLADFVRGGEGSAVFVEGAPGMGKTALVSRHLRETRRGRIPFWFTVRVASSPRHFVSALAHSLQVLGARQLAYYAQLPRPPTPKEVADLTSRALGSRQLVAVVDDTQLSSSELRRFLKEFAQGLIRGAGHRLYFISQEAPIFELEQVQTYHLAVGGLDRVSAHDLTDREGGWPIDSRRFTNPRWAHHSFFIWLSKTLTFQDLPPRCPAVCCVDFLNPSLKGFSRWPSQTNPFL